MATNLPETVPRLENLPSELQRQLLLILDFSELKALVHASAVFYCQYRLNRRYILCNYLDITLGSAVVDAYVVYQSSLAGFKEARSKETVVPLVKGYQDRLSRPYSIFNEKLSEEQAINMVTFFSSVMQPLIRHFISWALSNLVEATRYQALLCRFISWTWKEKTSYEEASKTSDGVLSRTEEIRIMRGFYRYQLCCNIFGEYWRWNWDTHSYTYDAFREFMYLLFEPWEIEEILCISGFVTNQYDSIFNRIDWEVGGDELFLLSDVDGFARVQNDPIGRSFYLLGTACHGLETLHDILFQPRRHRQLVSIIHEKIRKIEPGVLFDEVEGFPSIEEQDRLRRDYELDGNIKMQRAEALVFHGDGEPIAGKKHAP